MNTRTLAVVSAGLSVPSSTRLLADRLSAATVDALRERGADAAVEVVELRAHARDLADNLVTGFANASLAPVLETVAGADGLIAVTPIFSASYSGLFKSFFDVLDKDALVGKPVLMGATAGTARHSLAIDFAMRPLFAYLRAEVAPTGVFAASDDWGSGAVAASTVASSTVAASTVAASTVAASTVAGGTVAGGALGVRINRAAAELAALIVRRPQAGPADPFADAIPFAALLHGA